MEKHYLFVDKSHRWVNNEGDVFYNHCPIDTINLKISDGRWESLREGQWFRHTEVDTLYTAFETGTLSRHRDGRHNEISGFYTLLNIESAGLKDAWWKDGCSYGSMFHQDALNLRLNHILFDQKHWDLRQVDVVGNKDWSDHKVVVSGFDFK